MQNKPFKYFLGVVTIQVKGRNIESFLNDITSSGIHIWEIKRHNERTITFKIKLNDIKDISKLRKKEKLKLSFIKKEGAPFFLRRLSKSKGIVIGMLLFLLFTFLLSNVIWKIEISGASPQVEHNLNKQFKNMGITVGKLQFFIDNADTIQRKLTDNIEEITWIGVEQTGTKLKFTVVERERQEAEENVGIQNIVATKKAIVSKMFVERGKATVTVNEHVDKGQLLVSGVIGNEDNEKFVSAKAEILGETWYKTTVNLPMQLNLESVTGDVKRKYALKLGQYDLPLWNFKNYSNKDYYIENNENNLYFFRKKIPISIVKKSIMAKDNVTRTYSKEEALKVARQLARKNVLSKLGEEAVIKGENVLHETIDNGKVSLMIHFQVIENIGTGQPIIQGD